jgi:hypothetical protein
MAHRREPHPYPRRLRGHISGGWWWTLGLTRRALADWRVFKSESLCAAGLDKPLHDSHWELRLLAMSSDSSISHIPDDGTVNPSSVDSVSLPAAMNRVSSSGRICRR